MPVCACLLVHARSALLRGPSSFGAFLNAQGLDAVPSPRTRSPGAGLVFFNGGYTARHYCREKGVAATQAELGRLHRSLDAEAGSDNDALLAHAERFAVALALYLQAWYDIAKE